jgi:hypothetical protein
MNQGGYAVGIPKNTDIAFYDADPQEITFHFTNNIDENMVLLDQYTGTYYEIDDNTFQSDPIEISPGDGMLLKLCQLPIAEVINAANSCTIENMYIPYDVVVQDGGSLIINDAVEFGPHATLTIEDGGIVIVWGNVLFGTNSMIIVEGNLYLNPQNLLNTVLSSKTGSWQGIKCFEGGKIWVQNESIIENAETGIHCEGGEMHIIESTIRDCNRSIILRNASSLEFISSTIIVPDNEMSVGLFVPSNNLESDIHITGGTSQDNSLIQGMGEGNGRGISITSFFNNEEMKLLVENTLFDNLKEGIHLEGSVKTDDEILNCTFENCDTGIYLNGMGSMKLIRRCNFISSGTGIQLNSFKVPIAFCGFVSEIADCGIELDYVSGIPIDFPDPGKASVDSCSFSGTLIGIRCVNATPRVTNCSFYDYGNGIEVFNKSLVDMAWSANNTFEKIYNVKFIDSGSINILKGHNDFWERPEWYSYDFYFEFTYEPPPYQLNCNYNYWSDRPLDEFVQYPVYIDMNYEPIYNYEPSKFITADYYSMDDLQNVPPGWEADNRYEEAGILESEGYYTEALELYTTILSEQLEEEKGFWMNCIDRTFNLSLQLDENLNNLIQFYDTFTLNIPEFVPTEERDELSDFVINYQKKANIEMRNYQEAADIVIVRIEEPTSTVDSLFAVMELENIYFLASTENGRANVSTSFPQHEPEDCKQLRIWHDEHWEVLSKLLGLEENTEEIEQNIPLVPVLHNNYPNPFNPETTIKFSIPEDSKVKLTIYNIKGQKVKTLVNDELEKGIHEVLWTGKNDNNKSVASGVYFYKFDVNDKTRSVKKCLMLK